MIDAKNIHRLSAHILRAFLTSTILSLAKSSFLVLNLQYYFSSVEGLLIWPSAPPTATL